MKPEEKKHTCKEALTIAEVMADSDRNPDCKACTWMRKDWKK